LAEHPHFKPNIEPYLRKLSAAAQGVSVKANG
jgi:hypothetical protein